MKQLDIVVSPPAFSQNPYLTLASVTFDLDTQSQPVLDLDYEFLSSDFF